MEETKLKPCPFCGGDAITSNAGKTYATYCMNTNCTVSPEAEGLTVELSEKAWNTRHAGDVPGDEEINKAVNSIDVGTYGYYSDKSVNQRIGFKKGVKWLKEWMKGK